MGLLAGVAAVGGAGLDQVCGEAGQDVVLHQPASVGLAGEVDGVAGDEQVREHEAAHPLGGLDGARLGQEPAEVGNGEVGDGGEHRVHAVEAHLRGDDLSLVLDEVAQGAVLE
ncbi:hypothetical protein B7486_63630, partial [cyanobacterium TDX16]